LALAKERILGVRLRLESFAELPAVQQLDEQLLAWSVPS
jgi:hypothetical protein